LIISPVKNFNGVPALIVCDNCKQVVISNKDRLSSELNEDYGEWAEHNHSVILPSKLKKPKYKSSGENAVGILEKGLFHSLEEMEYFSLDQFNRDHRKHLDELNIAPFAKKEHTRRYYEYSALREQPIRWMKAAIPAARSRGSGG
jgi:transposase